MLWGKSVRGRIIEGGGRAASRTGRVGGAQCWREGCKIERERPWAESGWIGLIVLISYFNWKN